MKKKRWKPIRGSGWAKIFLTMRITVFFLLTGLLQVSASVYSQQTKLNLKVEKANVSKVLKSIEDQSDFHFLYRSDNLKDVPDVTINVKDAKLEDVLDELIVPFGFTYEIDDRTVVIKRNIPTESTNPAEQQKRKLAGIVKDSKGYSLPGVSVVVKGTTIGIVTDVNGEFRLSVPEDAKAMVFSFIGMKSKEYPINGNTTFIVVLDDEVVGLDDIVVVGYGSQKKLSVTGAISSVDSKDMAHSSSASLANALAGRLSGLISIQSNGGQPGRDDATMYLRGAATTNGKDPLILIDGVPRDNIRTLDANEVATVSILKDASATAVFGVRGANGVVLITTKRGSEGKTELSFNVEQSYTSFTREPERLHSVEYMNLRNQALANDGLSAAYSDAVIAKYANPLAGLDPNTSDYAEKAAIRKYIYCDNDYYRMYIKRYAPQTHINMNIKGGTDKVSYFVNAAYLHQGGNLNTEPKSVLGYDPSTKMDRYNFRANLDYKIKKTLKAFLNIGSYIEQVNMPCAGSLYTDDTAWMMSDLIQKAQSMLPITPGPTTIDGFGVPVGKMVVTDLVGRTAFEIMNRRGYRNEIRSNLNTSLGLDWDLSNTITKGLSMKGMISYDAKSTSAEQGAKTEQLYSANIDYNTDQLSYTLSRASESLLSISKSVDSKYSINMQGSINYHRTFQKHDVSGMFLAQRDYWETTSGEIPYNVLGVSGRAVYNYDNRYFGEFNMGYNGSEQFAPGKRFGFFPAASVGWLLSNEEFLKDNKIINSLKLRVSYGKVGNDQIGSSRFLYQDNITVGTGTYSSLGNGKGITQGLLGNSDITWEVSKKQNYGLDFQILKDISGSFDYFIENRSDILITRGTVPILQGVSLSNIPKVNMGKVDNHGFEIELKYNKSISKDLLVSAKGNFSYNKNKVKFYDEAIYDESYAYRYRTTGYSLRQAWGYRIDYSNGNGYFNSQQELDAYLATTKYGFGSPRVGDFKYIDLNKDGVVNDKDIAPIGNTNIPGINYGLTLSSNYKAFDFTIFFQGVGKYSQNYRAQGVYENAYTGIYFEYQRTAWTAERYANGEKITYPALSTQSTTNHTANSFFIMNRSFMRLKNMELGYTLPKSGLNTLGISKLRIYCSAQNLFTWDKLRMKHLDPETDNSMGYPVTKMLNFGLNVTF